MVILCRDHLWYAAGPWKPGERAFGEAAAAYQIFAKVDLLSIDNDSEKKKIAKKYKLVQTPWKLLLTVLLFTLCNVNLCLLYYILLSLPWALSLRIRIFNKTMPFQSGL